MPKKKLFLTWISFTFPSNIVINRWRCKTWTVFSEKQADSDSNLDPDTKAVKKVIFGFWKEKDNAGNFNTEIEIQEVTII